MMNALFREGPVWNEEDGLKRVVEALAQTPLAFPPGNNFRYGMSSDVLGLLLERVTKQPLDEILRQRVFKPLHMSDAGFFVRPEQSSRLTSYYSYEDGRLVRKESAANSPFLSRAKSFSGGGGWPDGYAGLVSTAVDWWRLCEMIRQRGELNGVRVLKSQTVDAMVSNQLSSVGDGCIPKHPGWGYGLGLGVITDRVQAKEPGSSGQVFWAGGPYNTYFFIDGEREMVGILLLQTGPWHHLELMSRFDEMAHRAIMEPPNAETAVSKKPSEGRNP
jgi:CubicO group peptidase (beta-lactamase class C family)